ncbi:tetratricopeptide repeat-containing sulfotransferase family protein [Acuticoccus sp. I52.16.1]|uniref:tetratricopeptide repeat-containing sulfotransferase family protein n=1 Tax=Acuticoccus sp. I52.16.1 TaxID=2928472 RepID=UPI001FD08F2C|nr:tetratricopeptide repeat-containing sulfotransferase family protein [Acuticoccus sp. I52.16.1]UOM35672.1 sulfotransferase [Acuticoccus sp. I52.16.1]
MTAAHSIDRTLAKARRLADHGDYLAAHEIYGEVLARYPTNARARDGLTALTRPAPLGPGDKPVARTLAEIRQHLAAGDPAAALRLAEPLARRHPGLVRTQYALGCVHLARGDAAAALGPLTAAVKTQPTCTAAVANLGTALAQLGHRGEAIACLTRVTALEPCSPQAHTRLGIALAEALRLDEAHAALDAALALDPYDAAALAARARVRTRLGLYSAAVADHEAVVAADPIAARPLIDLGNTLREARRYDAAVAAYEGAVALDPRAEVAFNNMGISLGDLGRTEEAEAAFRTAIALAPRYTEAHANLATWTRYREGHPHVAEMEALLAAETDAACRMQLGFALGKAYDDIGDVDRAFAHLAAANAARRTAVAYDEGLVARRFAALRAPFEAGPLPAYVGPTDDGPVPIFVIGLPRSGSSLTEQILSAHSRVDGAGETNAFDRAVRPLLAALQAGRPVTQDILADVRGRYRALVAELPVSAPVVVDKHLANQRWAGFIAAAFPDAKIVAMARDPVATCWSIFKLYFAVEGNDYGYDLAELGRYHRLATSLQAFWDGLMPGRILTLDYETLTLQPEATTRALLAHCGLAFEPACLDFHTSGRAVATASAGQVRRSIYTGSSEAWRRYEAHLGPLIAALAAKD